MLTLRPYDWNVQDELEGQVINLWAFDRASNPVLVRIEDFPAFCFIELPLNVGGRRIKWNKERCDIFMGWVKSMSGDEAHFKYAFNMKRKLYYHRGATKYPMLQVQWKKVSEMTRCVRLLNKPCRIEGLGMVVARAWEHEISPVRKILTELKMKYTQWFNVEQYITARDEDKTSTLLQEYNVNWRCIQPIDGNWSVNPKILAFDLETYSDNHKAFPIMRRPLHVITDCSIVCQRLGSPEERKKYLLVLQPNLEAEVITSFDDTEVITCRTEMDLIDELARIVQEYDPDVLSGYNIFGFDYPYLQARLDMYLRSWPNMGRLHNSPTVMKVKSWESSAYGHQEIHMLMMAGRISIDLLPIFKRDYKLDKYDLNTVSNKFLGRGKHDMDAATMFTAYEQYSQGLGIDLKLRVSKYCDEDSVLVLDLIQRTNTWLGLLEMSSIVGVSVMDLFTRGQQIRCLSQLYDVARQQGIVLDKRNIVIDKFAGGFVGQPIPGLYDYVICLDFNSLYPSIIRAYNICYTTLIPPEYESIVADEDCHVLEWEEDIPADSKKGVEDDVDEDEGEEVVVKKKYKFKFYKHQQGLVPYLCELLTIERKKVRTEMKRYCDSHGELLPTLTEDEKVTYIVLDKRQLALKVSSNSIYGFMGAVNGMLPLPEGAKATTAMGRMLLLTTNSYLMEKYEGSQIVYNDTDSTMIKLPFVKNNQECVEWGKKLEVEISALFPSPLYMEFEKAGRMLCIRKKKYSYWLIDTKTFEYRRDKNGNPDLMNKGIVLARRDNCKWQRGVFNKVLMMIMTGSSRIDVYNLIVDEIIAAARGDIPYDQLSVIRSIGASYKNPNYFMNIFKNELDRIGQPAHAGDRMEYVVVQGDERLGYKMRTIPWYLEGNEKIDMDYYIEKAAMNCIQQLYVVGYGEELKKAKEEYYTRDWQALFSEVCNMGRRDLVEVAFANNSTYEAAFESILNTKGLKTHLKSLKTYYITRFNRVPTRISPTPIKDLHKIIKHRAKITQTIDLYTIHGMNIRNGLRPTY